MSETYDRAATVESEYKVLSGSLKIDDSFIPHAYCKLCACFLVVGGIFVPSRTGAGI